MPWTGDGCVGAGLAEGTGGIEADYAALRTRLPKPLTRTGRAATVDGLTYFASTMRQSPIITIPMNSKAKASTAILPQ